MSAYLTRNKPARSQFRSPRRKRPTGLTVIHTAESVMDAIGVDTGAENVAAFIRKRKDPGSYHDLVDADSNLQIVEYGDEAYQDGTGSNPFALSISFACRTTDWAKMSDARRAKFLAQGAKAFARQQKWLESKGYPTTPLRRVTKAQSDQGKAGFISHGERDPGRRSDPGKDFPWGEWFKACADAIDPKPDKPAPVPPVPIIKEAKMYIVTKDPRPDNAGGTGQDWGTDGTSKFAFETQDAKNAWADVFDAERKNLPLEVFDAIPTVANT